MILKEILQEATKEEEMSFALFFVPSVISRSINPLSSCWRFTRLVF